PGNVRQLVNVIEQCVALTSSPVISDALVEQALGWADVAHLRARRYPELSGGEQQRVQFARVLGQCKAARGQGEPRYLLLD
ncbi:hypothetical protein LLE87_37525, partial [Paenibacillus polymyxa]|nr:hypothetical protein [Paenibacillus polymyxa]